MKTMQVSLEQWQAMLAIVDKGGYANAAEALNKSQSAISYAINKLEDALNIRVFKLEGRRAVLTAAGEMLYQRARLLVDSAAATEDAAHQLASHWQACIGLAVDAVFPEQLLFDALAQFGKNHPLTRINLFETVLSGANEVLTRRDAGLAITPFVPAGFVGDLILQLPMVAVAAPQHSLHHQDHALTLADLRNHRQLVVRDSGSQSVDAGWLGAEKRWTVSHMSTSIRAVENGLGFAWFPKRKITQQLANGLLVPLPLDTGSERHASLYLVYADGDFVSPACQQLGHLLKTVCQPA